MLNLHRRIAVIGAGPAGLAAARTLKELGHTDVTVFERRGDVGGKVESVVVDDRVYELGAVVTADSYRTVLPLAAQTGQELIEMPARLMVDADRAQTRSVEDYLGAHTGRLELASALARYWRMLSKYKSIYEPDLAFAPQDLCRPFGELLEDRRLTALEPLIGTVYTVLGYGYAQQMPAIYVLRLMDRAKVEIVMKTALGREQTWPRVFANGFQQLWRAVARDLDVRTGLGVEEVTRGETVRLGLTDGSEAEFDHLVVATAPGAAARFLDLSEAEQEVFTRVRTIHYHVTLFESERIPGLDHTRAYIEQSLQRDALGRPLLLLHSHADRDLYVSYAYGDTTIGQTQIQDQLRRDVERLGGRVRRVVEHRAWTDYFPHADCEALADGILERAAALQGHRHTWFAGGFFGFETVEDASAQATALMRQAFGANGRIGLQRAAEHVG